MYMYAHPGKKLNFMGNEIGQLREWDEKREQDWMLLDYPIHEGFARFMKDLNHLYLEHPALWEKDYEADGFRWIDCHQEANCIYVFERDSKKEKIISLMKNGNMAIIHIGPSEESPLSFSKNGHYLVISDIDENDNFYVINSNKIGDNQMGVPFDYDTIIKNMIGRKDSFNFLFIKKENRNF